jgi:hypothetical protein
VCCLSFPSTTVVVIAAAAAAVATIYQSSKSLMMSIWESTATSLLGGMRDARTKRLVTDVVVTCCVTRPPHRLEDEDTKRRCYC